MTGKDYIIAIKSKAEYIADLALDIITDDARQYTITEQAAYMDIYTQLCNISDVIGEYAAATETDNTPR